MEPASLAQVTDVQAREPFKMDGPVDSLKGFVRDSFFFLEAGTRPRRGALEIEA